MHDPEANRQITRRDARREGEPDVEQDAGIEDRMKEAQRDLTSLSGPPLRDKPGTAGGQAGGR